MLQKRRGDGSGNGLDGFRLASDGGGDDREHAYGTSGSGDSFDGRHIWAVMPLSMPSPRPSCTPLPWLGCGLSGPELEAVGDDDPLPSPVGVWRDRPVDGDDAPAPRVLPSPAVFDEVVLHLLALRREVDPSGGAFDALRSLEDREARDLLRAFLEPGDVSICRTRMPASSRPTRPSGSRPSSTATTRRSGVAAIETRSRRRARHCPAWA